MGRFTATLFVHTDEYPAQQGTVRRVVTRSQVANHVLDCRGHCARPWGDMALPSFVACVQIVEMAAIVVFIISILLSYDSAVVP